MRAVRVRSAEADFDVAAAGSVDGVVKRQAEIGLDIVNDGEYGHAMMTRLIRRMVDVSFCAFRRAVL